MIGIKRVLLFGFALVLVTLGAVAIGQSYSSPRAQAIGTASQP